MKTDLIIKFSPVLSAHLLLPSPVNRSLLLRLQFLSRKSISEVSLMSAVITDLGHFVMSQ